MTILSVSDFDKISPTALLTAYARQFTDIPYAKEIAQLTNAEATVDQLMSQEQEQEYPIFIGLAALIEARYKAIEQVKALFNGTQILELASGLLPRGMILSQNPEIIFIESDLPEMIQRKHQLVQQLIGERSNLHFLEINVTNSQDFQLLNDYFQPRKPVTVLCEGLMMYLTFAEKQQVFANVREILQTYGGVWITSDLATKTVSQQRQNDSAYMSVNQKFLSLTGRSFAENEFDDLEHVRQFALEQGFQAEEFSTLDVFNQLKSLSTLGIDLNRGKAIIAARPIFALTLV